MPLVFLSCGRPTQAERAHCEDFHVEHKNQATPLRPFIRALPPPQLTPVLRSSFLGALSLLGFFKKKVTKASLKFLMLPPQAQVDPAQSGNFLSSTGDIFLIHEGGYLLLYLLCCHLVAPPLVPTRNLEKYPTPSPCPFDPVLR